MPDADLATENRRLRYRIIELEEAVTDLTAKLVHAQQQIQSLRADLATHRKPQGVGILGVTVRQQT